MLLLMYANYVLLVKYNVYRINNIRIPTVLKQKNMNLLYHFFSNY